MRVSDVIEISLIEAENEGMDKNEAIEYAARANNVGVDLVKDVYDNLIDLQNRISERLGIEI